MSYFFQFQFFDLYNLGWKPVEVEWIRVPDLPHLNLTSKQTPHVYFSDGKKSRLKQGKIGNCWFCAVATTLSDYCQSNKDIHNVKHSRFTSEEYFGMNQLVSPRETRGYRFS